MEQLKEDICKSNRILFTDILLERRCTSDLMWASRAWNPKSAYIQPQKTSATKIKSIVLHSYRLRQVINEISKEENVEPEELYKKVEDILDEMGYNREVPILRWLGLFTAKILKKLCSAILINEEQLLKVKSGMGKTPMLFVPSHRSYGDFILMSYICFHYDLDIPRIAAGMDFHSMVIMGKILRDSCAFFMRRSFNNDKLYTAIFSQYVQTLVTDGDAAVEFFIEGTRSRTAKSLMPKFGFLSMALKPFLTGLVPDISIVPVNISYDRTLEEVLFAYELLGVPKPKESTKGFLKALSILNENYGNIYVRFGEPFSVKDYFGRKIDRSLHSFGPVQLQDLTVSETKQIVNLAHTIVNEQRDLTVITCFNLIAAILNDNIINGSEPFTLENLVKEVSWLYSIFIKLGVAVAVEDISEECVLHDLKLHKNIIGISSSDRVQLCLVHSKGTPVDPKKLKGYNLADSTMDVAVPLVMIQNYVNPCSYFLINLSIIALVVESGSRDTVINKDNLFRHFLFLRSIFSYEFVFYGGSEKEDFEKAYKLSEKFDIIKSTGQCAVSLGTNHKLRRFCYNVFASFLPSYIVTAEVLLEKPETNRSEADIFKNCQKKIEINLNNGRMVHPNNLSLDVLSNSLQAFTSVGLISKLKGNNEVRYSVRGDRLSSFYEILSSFDLVKNIELDVSEVFLTFVSGKL